MIGIVSVLYRAITKLSLPLAVITPLRYTAYLKQPPVRFNCSAGSHIIWLINGSICDTDCLHARGIETVRTRLESYLEISSTIQNSNTVIQCASLDGDYRYVPSENATFLVQGQFTILTDG